MRATPADLNPVIFIDSREQLPLVFANLKTESGTLQSGDYSIRGFELEFVVERKSIPDLVSCCVGYNRERFERELHRLRGFQFKRLLIIGSKNDIEEHRYRSKIHPNAIMGSLQAWEIRYQIPICWVEDPVTAAKQVEIWAYYFCREKLKAVSKFVSATS